MNRRELLKLSLLSPLLGLLPRRKIPVRFWVQTSGPVHERENITPVWLRISRPRLLGIYSGEELLGNKALDYPVGTNILSYDGRAYKCCGSSEDIVINDKGIYINEPS